MCVYQKRCQVKRRDGGRPYAAQTAARDIYRLGSAENIKSAGQATQTAATSHVVSWLKCQAYRNVGPSPFCIFFINCFSSVDQAVQMKSHWSALSVAAAKLPMCHDLLHDRTNEYAAILALGVTLWIETGGNDLVFNAPPHISVAQMCSVKTVVRYNHGVHSLSGPNETALVPPRKCKGL